MAFTNVIRLPIKLSRPQYPSERNVFRKANGKTMVISSVVRKLFQGETDFMPEPWHEKLAIALSHDYFVYTDLFRSVRLVQDGEYAIAWPDFLDYPVAKGTFTAVISPFDARNTNCDECEQGEGVTWVGRDPVCQKNFACAPGSVLSPDGTTCTTTTTQAATVGTTSPVIAAKDSAYGVYGTRIYAPGFSNSSIINFTPPAGDIFATMNSVPQWQGDNTTANNGPCNRCAIWVPAVPINSSLTIPFVYNNTGPLRTIYIGVFGDDVFTLKVNNVKVADSQTIIDMNFRYLHIFPATLLAGNNIINLIVKATGSTSACGMVVYDNAPEQIRDATADSQLNILYTSAILVGTSIPIATCADGWNLDLTGAPICKAIATAAPTGTNTGNKAFQNREKYNFGVPTGIIEPNIQDSNYVAPAVDTTMCPIT